MARYLAVTPAATRRQPLTLGFEEVAPRHISRYVRFDRVRLAEEATTWCDFDPETGDPVTTDRTLLDAAGRQFVVRTDRRCNYRPQTAARRRRNALRHRRVFQRPLPPSRHQPRILFDRQ